MENDKVYMGIDPGSKGFISIQKYGEFSFYSIEDNDLYQLSKIMADLRSNNANIACAIEDVHAVFGSAAGTTFTFGFNKGYLIGLLAANNIPYVLVQPKIWQKEMWGNSDIVPKYKEVTVKGKKVIRKEVNTKATSINAAKRLFPQIDFRKTIRCKNLDDNKVDATLMSEYARRKNL
jgi:adenylate cyclase class IV